MKLHDKVLLGVAALCVVLAVSVAVYRTVAPRQTFAPAPFPQTGRDTVAVLFLSTACAYCTDPAGIREVRGVLDSLRHRPHRPVLIAAALDTDVYGGLELIRKYGHFDELVLGNGMLNTAAVHYIWADSVPYLAVPQLAIYERSIVRSDSGSAVAIGYDTARRVSGLQLIAAEFRGMLPGH
jgi:hypothetical protein